MTDPTDSANAAREHERESGRGGHSGQEPVGTLFVLMVYVMVLAGMWGTMYWFMVTR